MISRWHDLTCDLQWLNFPRFTYSMVSTQTTWGLLWLAGVLCDLLLYSAPSSAEQCSLAVSLTFGLNLNSGSCYEKHQVQTSFFFYYQWQTYQSWFPVAEYFISPLFSNIKPKKIQVALIAAVLCPVFDNGATLITEVPSIMQVFFFLFNLFFILLTAMMTLPFHLSKNTDLLSPAFYFIFFGCAFECVLRQVWVRTLRFVSSLLQDLEMSHCVCRGDTSCPHKYSKP